MPVLARDSTFLPLRNRLPRKLQSLSTMQEETPLPFGSDPGKKNKRNISSSGRFLYN